MPTRIRLLAAVMAAAFAIACGGTPPAGSSPTGGASASLAQGELPKPELTKIRIGISTPNEPVQFAEKLADSLGLYQKYGITDVTVTGFEGDGKALQALIAGQLDMFVGGASTAISSSVTPDPVKIVAMNSTTLTDGLWCTKDIKAPADVKGKPVHVSSFGGTSHGSALLLLKGINLTDKDATITVTGNQGTRIAALKAPGASGCGVVDMSQQKAMQEAGMNLLFDLSKSKLQWGRSGLMAKVDFIQKNPNTVLVVTAATLEAQNSIWKDTNTAATKFAEFAQIKPDDAKSLVTAFLDYGSRSMLFSDDALIAPRDVLGAVNQAVKNVDVKTAYDLGFLKKLQDTGFYTKIGAPTQ